MIESDTNGALIGLSIETAAAVGGVALGRGDSVVKSRVLPTPRAHAVDLLPAIDALCRDCCVPPTQLSVVCVSCGPGSFTGLRIGIAVARMLALAVGARVVAVPTLEVIAQNAADAETPPDRVAVIMDAKRSRVYAAAFDRKANKYVADAGAIEVSPAKFLADQPRGCAVLGPGVHDHKTAVDASGLVVLPESLFAPRAATVYELGIAMERRGAEVNPRELIPNYVRRPEAEERWERRQADKTPRR